MTEPADERPAPALSKPRTRRSRRFVMPDDQHDERTAARIEDFLHGNRSPRRRPAAASQGSDEAKASRELDTRADWAAAFRHEASRHARYGRPASVLLLEIGRTPDTRSADSVALELAEMIRSGARASDRAVRLGPSSFRLLMPETNATGARQVGVRLEHAFQRAGNGSTHRPGLRFDVAAPTRSNSLEDALTEAERRVAR